MKKITIYFCITAICSLSINAQEIITSSGDYYESSNASLSWTIGESMTETYTSGTTILTQGFQQSRLTAISIFELDDLNITIKIAPNPTPDIITLYIDNYKDINYQLYDFNGKLLKQSDVLSEETEINFTHLAYAAYFLKIMKGKQMIKSFQIIKQ